jgi:FlgD Ig-like domain
LKRKAALAAFWATIPGPKMLWQFEEIGYDVSINVPCRTCPKPIRWDYLQYGPRELLFKKYAAIINLKTKYPEAFRSSSYDISAWGKQKQIHVNSTAMNVTVIGNFDVYNQATYTGFQHTGRWYNYMAGDSLEVTNTAMTVNLAPGDFRIYTDVRLPKPDLSVTAQPVSSSEGAEQEIQGSVYPNPFSQQTTFTFEMPRAGEVSLQIFDLMGKVVWQETVGALPAGTQELVWDGISLDGNHCAAGTYIFKIQAGQAIWQGKAVLTP